MDTILIIYCILNLMCSAGVGFCVQRFINLLAASPQAFFGQMYFAIHFFVIFNANGTSSTPTGRISTPSRRFQRQQADSVLLAMNLRMKINLFIASGAISNANGPLQRQRHSFNAKRATNISTPPGGIECTLGQVARPTTSGNL